MISTYASPRDHLDDVVALVERMITRLALAARVDTDARALAELDLQIARHRELVVARREATAATLGECLPLDRLAMACELSPTELEVLAILAALEVAGTARRAAADMIPERMASAVLRAAYLAAADGGPIEMRHLQRAATLEANAMGRIVGDL
jgi:hypothetical protein